MILFLAWALAILIGSMFFGLLIASFIRPDRDEEPNSGAPEGTWRGE
jgi:hypothetical protein